MVECSLLLFGEKLGMGDGEFERMGEIAPGCWDGYIMHPGSNGRRVLGVEGEKEIRTVKRSLLQPASGVIYVNGRCFCVLREKIGMAERDV
ncbi:hypothetical protein CDAR_59131 [Caerostris darwini]|uniref:Uncharacterized protein n=1 Tax=Caerostris darwini TaxID=1538125 RepID=A0AAV4X5G7_9ARAC|nr:hypothetical protein CDAR_59131 [Caerostris darwini]